MDGKRVSVGRTIGLGVTKGECSRPISKVPLQAAARSKMRSVDKARDFMGPPNANGLRFPFYDGGVSGRWQTGYDLETWEFELEKASSIRLSQQEDAG
jgi:hypothetical protein